MSLLGLPVELIDAVFSHLQPKQLTALSQTSSFVSTVARRRLYRHVTVSPTLHNLRVVIILSKEPDLARFVRSFSLELDTRAPLFSAFYYHLSRTLRQMTELVSLSIRGDPHLSWVLPGPPALYNSRLQSFGCSFPPDYHVVNFLQNCGSLRELELCVSASTGDICLLPATSMPHLSQLVGSADAARAFVPGRPVTNVYLTSGDITEETIEDISKSTAPITVLSASTSSPVLSLLYHIAKKMPHLVCLQLITRDFSQSLSASFHENVAHALASLHDLQSFELSGMQWGSIKAEDDASRVWQSKPLEMDSSSHVLESSAIDVYSEFFVDY